MNTPTREWQMPELLPCPFCDSSDIEYGGGNHDSHWFCFNGCGVSTSEIGVTDRAAAVAKWNTRAVTKAPPMPAIAQQEADRIIAALDPSDGGYAHIAAFIQGLVSAKD